MSENFDKRDFVYIEADDAYRCPAGEKLIHRGSSLKDGMRKSTLTRAESQLRVTG